MCACAVGAQGLHLNSQTQVFQGKYPVRANIPLFFTIGLALSACSINDDLRQFRSTVPERISGLSWLDLVPLGNFDSLAPLPPAPDARSLAARAAALRAQAAQLRARPVLDPARAHAMRAALRRVAR